MIKLIKLYNFINYEYIIWSILFIKILDKIIGKNICMHQYNNFNLFFDYQISEYHQEILYNLMYIIFIKILGKIIDKNICMHR